MSTTNFNKYPVTGQHSNFNNQSNKVKANYNNQYKNNKNNKNKQYNNQSKGLTQSNNNVFPAADQYRNTTNQKPVNYNNYRQGFSPSRSKGKKSFRRFRLVFKNRWKIYVCYSFKVLTRLWSLQLKRLKLANYAQADQRVIGRIKDYFGMKMRYNRYFLHTFLVVPRQYHIPIDANEKLGLLKKKRGLAISYQYRRHQQKHYRNITDNRVKDLILDKKKEYQESLYKKNNFWMQDRPRFQYLSKLWRRYRLQKVWRPYSYLLKKYKIFFNWFDKYVLKRWPLYRRKYEVSFLYPLYQDYRFLHRTQIKQQQFFRWLFRLKYQQLVDKFKKAVKGTKRSFERMFLNFFELRMDMVVYRLNFAFSNKQGKQWVNRSFFKVNSKNIGWHSYHVNLSDIIVPIDSLRLNNKYKGQHTPDFGQSYLDVRLFYRQIQADQYPSHFFWNERIPAGLLWSLPDPYQVRFYRPFSIQFLTLSLNKFS